jgi:hypothetical protein
LDVPGALAAVGLALAMAVSADLISRQFYRSGAPGVALQDDVESQAAAAK